MRLGFLELAVILVIVAMLVGPKQIPKLTTAISDSVKKFKTELKEDGVEDSVKIDS